MSAPAPAAATRTTAAATEAPTTTGATGPEIRRRSGPARRALRWWGPIALAVVLSAVIGALAFRSQGGRLDPVEAGPEGARAVAEVLRDQGVDVRRVTRSADAASAAAGGTLVIVSTGLLGPAQLDTIASADIRHLVLVAPDAIVLDALAPQVRPAGIAAEAVREPGCDAADARAAGPASGGGAQYAADPPAVVCYRAPDGAGSYVVTRVGQRTVTVLGASDVLVNAQVTRHGNAALALRTLGRYERLTWYVPDPLETSDAADPVQPTDLLPAWVRWVVVQLVLVSGVAILWRARRLGPLVTEPLPVIVRAAETEEGRARLYRQSGARGRAAATLRTAAARRLARRLSVPPDTPPADLVTVVATAAGRPPAEVELLLLGPAPGTDGALLHLARQINTLEQELTGLPGPAPSAGPAHDGPARHGTSPRHRVDDEYPTG